MKKEYFSRIIIAGMTAVLTCSLLYLGGCKEEKGNSAYSLVTPGKPQPTIDSISPAGSALAASEPITIYGTNFSATPAENFVFFNAKAAKVLSATATRLVVTSAVDSGNVLVKTSVAGAELYSAAIPYRLNLGVEAFGNFTPPATGVAGITPDSAGNLYFDLLGAGVDNGIYIMPPDGSKRNFIPKTPGITYWASLKLGPAGTLYAARGASAVFKFGLTDTAFGVWVRAAGTAKDIDFDQSKNLWAGGNSVGLNCIKQDKSVTLAPFTGAVRALRVYGGSLYFSALKDSVEKIFKATITGDNLGAPEEYFNITSSVGAAYIGQTLTFSSDGYLYIGTQSPVGLIIVAPDRSFTTLHSAYASLFGTQISCLAWGPGDVLYASTFEGNLLKIYTKKTGAPYYGLN